MNILEQKEFTYKGNRYLFTALDATTGMSAFNKLAEFSKADVMSAVSFIKGIVMQSATLNSKVIDENLFNKHYSRNYTELNEVFGEIIKFNFGEMGDDNLPNGQGDTSD